MPGLLSIAPPSVLEQIKKGALLPASTVENAIEKEVSHLKVHEGFKPYAYVDTEGYLTAGYGHKLTKEEIAKIPKNQRVPDEKGNLQHIIYTKEQTDKWFDNDTAKAIRNAKALVGENVPPEVFGILLNMSFNMGQAGVGKFAGMLKAIKDKDYKRAALEMEFTNPDKDISEEGWTPWRTQVPTRAASLINRMSNTSKQ